MDNAALLQLFVDSLKAQGSPQTQARYERACQTLLIEAGDTALAQLTRQDARRALARLRAKGWSPRTLAVTLSAWKAWFRHLAKTHPGFDDCLTGLRAPKAPKRLPNALSEMEAMRLVEPDPKLAAAAAASDDAIRDQALFEVLYGCGIRVGELVGLDLPDVDLANGELRVFGKGRKERIAPLGGRAREALALWLQHRSQLLSPAGDTERALFLGVRGGRITPQVVRLALKRRAIERNISTHVYPHRLRHSFASHVLQSSRDLRAVQELMGHASIASTQVYTHLDFQHLAQVYDQAHPRARKSKK